MKLKFAAHYFPQSFFDSLPLYYLLSIITSLTVQAVITFLIYLAAETLWNEIPAKETEFSLDLQSTYMKFYKS